MRTTGGVRLLVWLPLLAALVIAAPLGAQQILLDKPVRAGELTVFPDLNDETSYYYVADKVHLATDANGTPEFSFLRYVQNVRSGATEAEAREGEGGGIVHAVVALEVTPDQLKDAQRDLQRLKPGAKIQGPVVYKSGKFGLVSSFTDPKGNLSVQVVGLGNAPILDGQKAAVSMQLTKLGAKVLWESFHTATPDISFTFEMELDGFRSPKRALIEADFDQIYQHRAFAIAGTTPLLAAEIKSAYDDLRQKNAIKVTQVGTDEQMEALVTTAYNKLMEIMFSPANGTGTPSLDSLTNMAGGESLLDKASAMLEKRRADVKAENEQAKREREEAEEKKRTEAEKPTAPATGAQTPPAPAATEPQPPAPATTGKPGMFGGLAALFAGAGANRPKPYSESKPTDGGEYATKTAKPEDKPNPAPTPPKAETKVPVFAAIATYELKTVRQHGTYKIDLNKYTTDGLTMRFDQNIGDLRSLLDDPGHFLSVNLDDPLYQQREIVVFVDGLNAQDFGQYINFVTVHMRKHHAGGDLTDDEVRIDRANFNKEGNNFKLMYGWKGDNDRTRWMEYEYQPTWSFFGGKTLEGPWQKATAGAINLAPAYLRHTVDLQADPDALTKAQVRLVTVKIYYDLGGAEQMKQAVLNPAKQQLSANVEFMLPRDKQEYGYEISWRLAGDRTVTSGRKTSSDPVLLCDEVPAG